MFILDPANIITRKVSLLDMAKPVMGRN